MRLVGGGRDRKLDQQGEAVLGVAGGMMYGGSFDVGKMEILRLGSQGGCPIVDEACGAWRGGGRGGGSGVESTRRRGVGCCGLMYGCDE